MAHRFQFSLMATAMPVYRVEINAKNFLVDLGGTVAKYGFVTHRFVTADDAASAENAAVEVLRNDGELRSMVKNQPGDPPVMDVTEIIELDGQANQPLGQPGRLWYELNPKRWWQFWR
jgi:hypothetical protein